MHRSFERPHGAEERPDGAGDAAAQQPLHLAAPSPACDRIEPLLEAFHDVALSDADERLVREHVASCQRCAAHLRSYDVIDSVLRLAPAPRVGPELRERLYTRIAATQQPHGIFAALHALRKTPNAQKAQEHPALASGVGAKTPRGSFGIGGHSLVTSWINGVAAIAVVLLLVLLFNTLTSMPNRISTSSVLTATAQVVASVAALPKFGDYRAAYLDSDGHLCIVAANGKAIIGPSLPHAGLLMRMPATPYYDVTASQDGHFLAYVEGDASVSDPTTMLPDGGPVALLDLRTGKTVSVPVQASDLSWSTDSRYLAAPDVTNFTDINIIDAMTGTLRQLAVSFEGAQAFIPLVAGWIDTMHIAVFYQVPSQRQWVVTPTPTPAATAQAQFGLHSGGTFHQSVGSLDIRSGAITYLADLPDPSDVFLTPDGQQLLLAPNYSTATASIIDVKTGQMRALPSISRAFVRRFAHLGAGGNWSLHSAWQPRARHVLAISLSIGDGTSRQEPGTWLLDLDRDSATPVAANAYPLAWFPEPPQALLTCDPPRPDASGNYPQGGAGVGPTLSTFAPVAPGGASHPLAGSMLSFLGLVRTA